MKKIKRIWKKSLKHFRLGLPNENEPWQISAARFCKDHDFGFTQQELFDFLVSLNVPSGARTQFFQDTISHPVGSKFGRDHVGGVWFPPIELVSMVIDYDELKEARRNAIQAWRFSTSALAVSVLSVLIQLIAWLADS